MNFCKQKKRVLNLSISLMLVMMVSKLNPMSVFSENERLVASSDVENEEIIEESLNNQKDDNKTEYKKEQEVKEESQEDLEEAKRDKTWEENSEYDYYEYSEEDFEVEKVQKEEEVVELVEEVKEEYYKKDNYDSVADTKKEDLEEEAKNDKNWGEDSEYDYYEYNEEDFEVEKVQKEEEVVELVEDIEEDKVIETPSEYETCEYETYEYDEADFGETVKIDIEVVEGEEDKAMLESSMQVLEKEDELYKDDEEKVEEERRERIIRQSEYYLESEIIVEIITDDIVDFGIASPLKNSEYGLVRVRVTSDIGYKIEMRLDGEFLNEKGELFGDGFLKALPEGESSPVAITSEPVVLYKKEEPAIQTREHLILLRLFTEDSYYGVTPGTYSGKINVSVTPVHED